MDAEEALLLCKGICPKCRTPDLEERLEGGPDGPRLVLECPCCGQAWRFRLARPPEGLLAVREFEVKLAALRETAKAMEDLVAQRRYECSTIFPKLVLAIAKWCLDEAALLARKGCREAAFAMLRAAEHVLARVREMYGDPYLSGALRKLKQAGVV